MKFQKMIRVQLMLVGLGAGLLLAKPVYAQQDTDPTLFEATSWASQQGQEGFNAPVAPQAAMSVQAETTAPLAVQEEDASVLTSADVNSILALVVGIGSIVLMGIAEAVRGSRRRTWRTAGSRQYPSGATAN
jgi:predicted cobalt transporter CbtA